MNQDCWSGNISKFDRGRLQKIVKKAEKPLESFMTLQEKRLYRKLMQILNDPIHPMRHYLTLIADTATGVEFFTYTKHYKALFLPLALSVFNDNYTSY